MSSRGVVDARHKVILLAFRAGDAGSNPAGSICGGSVMVTREPSKLELGVRFPFPALSRVGLSGGGRMTMPALTSLGGSYSRRDGRPNHIPCEYVGCDGETTHRPSRQGRWDRNLSSTNGRGYGNPMAIGTLAGSTDKSMIRSMPPHINQELIGEIQVGGRAEYGRESRYFNHP